jgi:diguanylate cyclase (GGDEF)-like protein
MPINRTMPSAISPPRWARLLQGVTVICLIGGFILDAPRDHWDLPLLAVLLAVGVASDMIAVKSESLLKISGASLALVLGAVLLGGVPAALIGAAIILIGWLRWREEGHYLRNNLIAFATFPFLAGVVFHATVGWLGLSAHRPEYYLLVVPAYATAVGLNFWIVVGYQCLLDGRSLLAETKQMLRELTTSELLCAVLTAGIARLYLSVGLAGLLLVALLLVAYQHVVGQLLVSRERAEQLRRQAITDELTGLPNRAEFIARTRAALAQESAAGAGPGVMLMDLDDFKQINDALGHHTGDLLLTRVGTRLRETLDERHLVARLSGDEFAVLVENDPGRDRLVALGHTITAAFEQPFDVGDLSLEISVSIGIAHAPIDGTDVNTLLKHADVAMYAAKDGRTHVELYRTEINRNSAQHLALTADLRAGIASGQILLEYQPKVDIATGQLTGVEALARWEHPSLGRIPPAKFITLAEHTGLIRPLTERVFDLALAQLGEWQRAGLDLHLAINLSARLLSDRRLPDQVRRQIDEAGVCPERVALEITETMVLRDPARAATTLTQLHQSGIGLSIDDFGTGYSSLAYLRELPLDEIKVDRRFVSRMADDPTDAVIVRSTVELGRSLRLRTVAEGIEDIETLLLLRRMRCDVGQGFHFSRPLPPAELLGWLEAQRALARLADVS